LEQLPGDVGFIPNLSHYCRKLAFFMLHAFGPRMQASTHPCGPRATLVI